MEFRKRETLRKSRIFLLDNIIFDVLTDHLIDQDIFSDSMLDHIKAGSDRVEKIRRMLDYLIRRPDSCYFRFLDALENSGHEHCMRYIKERYIQSGATQVTDPAAIGATPLSRSMPCWGLPDEDVPMEQSCPSDPHQNFLPPTHGVPAESTPRFGFPEITVSMNAFAGSFSTPVQESSVPGREIIPSTTHYDDLPADVERMSAWPSDSQPVHHFASSQENLTMYKRHMLSNPHGIYKMDSSPRGMALVINNENFKTMPIRTGSKRDMESLHLLFKKLGFHVCHEVDKTAHEMRDLLTTFAKFKPLEHVDALAIVILSHGGRDGAIFGRDGSHGKGHARDYITDVAICDIFSAQNCPLMAHKPKLIIIQACRGLNEDEAIGVSVPSRSPNSGNNVTDSNNKNHLGQDGGSFTSNTSTASSSRIAKLADICMIHSTVQGYVSYRHPIEGSPFIQEMTKVFQDMATREHLTDMMTEVTRKLATRELQEDLRTVPSTTNTLTRKWFLNPLNVNA